MRALQWVFVFLALIGAAGRAPASGGLRGPVMGYVLDQNSGQLRPISGIPGAAVISSAILPDVTLSAFAASGGGEWALGLTRQDARLVLVDLAAVQARVLDIVPESASRVVLSPNGRAAAVELSGRVAVISGLPDQPARVADIDTTGLGGALAGFAIDDQAQALVLGASGGLYAVSVAGGGPPGLVRSMDAVSAVRFLAGRKDAVYVDAAGGAVYLLRDAAGASESIPLAGAGDGLDQPLDVADAGPAGVAVAVASGLALIAPDTRAVRLIECDCSPTLLAPMMDNLAFRLTEPAGTAARLVDLSGAAPRVFYLPPPAVPPPPAAADNSESTGGAQ